VRSVILALCCLAGASIAAAQDVEVGGSVAAACLGSDGSACGSGTHALLGAHVSWWIDDRVEVSGRVARVARPDHHFTQSFPSALEVSITDRSRDFLSAAVIYHFRRGGRVRPMLGAGSGAFAHVERVACQPLACELSPGLPPSGAQRRWRPDVIVVAGLSGTAGKRWTWRAGWLTHSFANDHNSTIETFAGVGYRFGK